MLIIYLNLNGFLNNILMFLKSFIFFFALGKPKKKVNNYLKNLYFY